MLFHQKEEKDADDFFEVRKKLNNLNFEQFTSFIEVLKDEEVGQKDLANDLEQYMAGKVYSRKDRGYSIQIWG